VQRRNEKNVHVVMKGHVVITKEDVILRKMIGSVLLATMSTSLGELNATVVEKQRKGTSRRTNHQDERIIAQISDVSDLVKELMVKTIGNALLATTSTSRSEQNAIAVEKRSQVVEVMIVHAEDSVEIEMEAEVLVEIVEVAILTAVVEAETVGETSEEIEEVVILTGVEAEEVVTNDVIQDEVVQIGITIVQTSAIEKQEESGQDMRTIEDHSQYVRVAIKAKIEMIEVNM